MNDEYVIKVNMTPHIHDNPANPYFWCVMKFDGVWCNECSGWAKTPEQAFADAHDEYQEMFAALNG